MSKKLRAMALFAASKTATNEADMLATAKRFYHEFILNKNLEADVEKAEASFTKDEEIQTEGNKEEADGCIWENPLFVGKAIILKLNKLYYYEEASRVAHYMAARRGLNLEQTITAIAEAFNKDYTFIDKKDRMYNTSVNTSVGYSSLEKVRMAISEAGLEDYVLN